MSMGAFSIPCLFSPVLLLHFLHTVWGAFLYSLIFFFSLKFAKNWKETKLVVCGGIHQRVEFTEYKQKIVKDLSSKIKFKTFHSIWQNSKQRKIIVIINCWFWTTVKRRLLWARERVILNEVTSYSTHTCIADIMVDRSMKYTFWHGIWNPDMSGFWEAVC